MAPRIHTGPQFDVRMGDLLFLTTVCVVVLFGVLLRFGGMPTGEPFYINVDEPTFVVRAVRILATGDFNPHWFGHPGSLTIYLLSAVYYVQYTLSGVPLSTLPDVLAASPEQFYRAGKNVIIFMSSLQLVAAFFVMRLFVPRWYALLGLAMLALAPLDVAYATLIRTDVNQSLLLVVLAAALVWGVTTGRTAAFIVAGILLGLAVTVKWPSVVACVGVVAAALLAPSALKGGRWLLRAIALAVAAAAASVVAAFVAAPYIFLDFSRVLYDVTVEARDYHLSATSSSPLNNGIKYAALLTDSLGVPGIALVAVGLVAGFISRRRRRQFAVIVALYAAYFLFISFQKLWWDRWGVPLLPFAVLSAAIGAWALVALVRHISSSTVASIALAIVIWLAAALPMAQHVATMLREQASPSEFVKASHWIVDHVPNGASILTEYAAPPIAATRGYKILQVNKDGQVEQARSASRYLIPSNSAFVGNLVDISVLDEVDFVILGNLRSRFQAESARYQRELAVYSEIDRKFRLVKTIDQYSFYEKPG